MSNNFDKIFKKCHKHGYNNCNCKIKIFYILDTQEVKTTWHPIENIKSGKKNY